MKNQSRDRALDRTIGPALRRSRQEGGDGCPDAEALAAWSENGLLPPLREQVDAHLAGCARCQDHVAALARSATLAPSPAPRRQWLSWRWLVPAVAGATALAVWVAVQPESPVTAPEPPPSTLAAARDIELPAPKPATPAERFEADKKEHARAVHPPPPAAAPLAAEPIPSSPAQAGSLARSLPAESGVAAQTQDVGRENQARAEESKAPAARLTAKAKLAAADAVTSLEIVSSDPSVRWRIRGTNVEHSVDSGLTWAPQRTGTQELLTAGASPSPDVCWMVGRAGTVLRSIDGRTWQATPFPEKADLVEVQSTGPAHATVKTADARRFTTTDGGTTWSRVKPQEF